MFGVYGCLSLKSEYPEIKLYKLNQEPAGFKNISTLDGIIQIRTFTSAEDINTDHFLAMWDGTRIQNYFYYRWVTTASDLVTDFVISRFNTFKVFKGGAIKTQTMLVPDYIMEGHIIDMIAHNSTKTDDGANTVSVSVQINILKREPLKADKKIILTKVYSANATRATNEASNIAPAFSKAVSQLSDNIITDIAEILEKQNSTK